MQFTLLLILVLLLGNSAKAQFRSTTESRDGRADSLRIADSATNAEQQSLTHHHKKEFLENDVAFGGTLGTPGGLNFIAEGYYGPVGLRMEGGAMIILLAVVTGWQTDFSFVLSRSSNALVECSAIYFQSIIASVDNLQGT